MMMRVRNSSFARGRVHDRDLQVAVCLLAAATLCVVIPVADTSAAEHDPYHLHIVIGGTAVQRAEAMARHLHGGRSVATHRPDAAPAAEPGLCGAPDGPDAAGPRVFSVLPSVSLGAMVLSAAGLSSAVPEAPCAFVAACTSSRLAALPRLPFHQTILSVPDPPPREISPT
jgi:hypothetical protein